MTRVVRGCDGSDVWVRDTCRAPHCSQSEIITMDGLCAAHRADRNYQSEVAQMPIDYPVRCLKVVWCYHLGCQRGVRWCDDCADTDGMPRLGMCEDIGCRDVGGR